MSGKQRKWKVAMMIILAMVLQIFEPVVQTIYAMGDNEPFRVERVNVNEGKATIDWEFILDTDNAIEGYTYDVELILEEIAQGLLVANDNTLIGTYTVSETGKLDIKIEEGLYKELEDKRQDFETTTPEALMKKLTRTFEGMIVLEGAYDKDVVLDKVGLLSIQPVVPDTVIHTVIAKNQANGTKIQDLTNYRPKIGDELWLEIEFALDADHSYGDGSVLTYELPTPLKAANGIGQLSQDGIIYATYKVENGKVVITFNENVRQYDNGIAIQKGYFGITAKFESNSMDLEQNLVLPDKDAAEGSITIPLNFQPKGGIALDKSVSPTSGANTKELTWTVNVNTLMNDLDLGKEFKDTLEGNHKYKPGSLWVTRYNLGNDGSTRITSQDVTSSFTQFIGTESSFTLNLTGKYAYEIKYVTIPGDTEEPSQTLKNKAEFDGKSVVKSSTITYGKPIDKKGTAISPRGTTNWEVIVNANEKTIVAGTTITDTWSEGHKLDGAITVDGLATSDYTVAHNDNELGFILTLNRSVSNKFKINYNTKLTDVNGVISYNTPITNEAIRSDRTDKVEDRKKTINYNQNVLSKTNSNINYQDKTVDWTITINSAKYSMKDIVLIDKFANKNLKIKDNTFVVKKGNTVLSSPSDYILALGEFDTDGTLTESNEKAGFKLTIPNTSGDTASYTVTYTTYYDIKDASDPTTPEYKNTAQIKWKTNGKDYTSPKIESIVKINEQQKKNGYKEGYYNYEEKKFYWEVGVNYNFDTISKPRFTDTLSSLQIIDRNSIEVYLLDLSQGDNGKIIGDALVENTDYTLTSAPLTNTFTITFNNQITTPYRIMYTSTTNMIIMNHRLIATR